ncbi:rare lipoprotein A (peptidoglycan hydrolase) [Azospirillum fermentarium]|uniref:septal ring lytic transglycosylase RlpA family protein n=1 Tax=Azospirillum fermentarium TaxID=1233114 RepID=UPI0022269E9D|nr:septal ring lytic transglycosylase RlpA family protein [Azospirillum fermentarium]MCW2247490.1 rare lipoprotein A (peptidoglycan hydrolase) [Azospirillum fermentarium]
MIRHGLMRAAVAGWACLLLVPPALADGGPSKPRLSVERDGGEPVIVHQGEGSFYGGGFHGRETASGDRFDQNAATAASRTLPLGTRATVTNQETGRSAEVTVNDRGPYAGNRVVDVSKGTAETLGITGKDGTAPVRVEARPSDQSDPQVREKLEEKAGSLEKQGR